MLNLQSRGGREYGDEGPRRKGRGEESCEQGGQKKGVMKESGEERERCVIFLLQYIVNRFFFKSKHEKLI